MRKREMSKILLGVLTITMFAMPVKSVYASVMPSDIVEGKKIISKKVEEKNESKLFEKAKSETNTLTESSVPKDENGNVIYETSQQIETYTDKYGQIYESYSTVTFQKIETGANTRASQSDGTWDKSSSAYLSSTIYYTKTTYNGRACVRLDSASGSVSKLNSGVRVQNLYVTIGCVGLNATNQSTSKSFGTSTSFSMTAPSSWKPNPAVYGQYGSVVGCTMEVKLGRSSSSTWTQTFSNRL